VVLLTFHDWELTIVVKKWATPELVHVIALFTTWIYPRLVQLMSTKQPLSFDYLLGWIPKQRNHLR
jgi:hypothetical protein